MQHLLDLHPAVPLPPSINKHLTACLCPLPWLPQECKISGGAGFSKSWVQGGSAYSIPLRTVSIGYEPLPPP